MAKQPQTKISIEVIGQYVATPPFQIGTRFRNLPVVHMYYNNLETLIARVLEKVFRYLLDNPFFTPFTIWIPTELQAQAVDPDGEEATRLSRWG